MHTEFWCLCTIFIAFSKKNACNFFTAGEYFAAKKSFNNFLHIDRKMLQKYLPLGYFLAYFLRGNIKEYDHKLFYICHVLWINALALDLFWTAALIFLPYPLFVILPFKMEILEKSKST